MEMRYKDVEGYIKVSDYLESLEIIRLSAAHVDGDDIRDGIRVGIERSMMEAKYFPRADVKPVKHGKWNAVKGALHPAEMSAVCSNCGFATMIHAQTYYHFCPECGAKMEKE